MSKVFIEEKIFERLMNKVDVDVKNKDYQMLMSFLNKNNCEIIIDHKIRRGHMMTIKAPNSDIARDIISNNYLNQNKYE
tara:strand:- start:237 stop:473 length:237 start_codon:yes stop_codon:yes gene_type:complete